MTSQYGSSRRIDRITPLFFADCCRCYLEFFGSTSLSSQMLHYGFRHRTSAYISQTDKQYFRHDRKDNIKTKKHTLQRTQLTDRYLRYNLPYCFNGRTFCKVLNYWCVRCSGDDARRAGKKERRKEGSAASAENKHPCKATPVRVVLFSGSREMLAENKTRAPRRADDDRQIISDAGSSPA